MSSPRFIDLEISGTTLANMVLNRVRTQVIFSPAPLSLMNPNDSILDHISFDSQPQIVAASTNVTQTVQVAGGGSAQVSGPQAQIQLGGRLFVKLISVAQDPKQSQNTYEYLPSGLPFTLLLNLSMQGQPGTTELCLTVSDITSPLQIPQLLTALAQFKIQLEAAGPTCVPFDIGGMISLLGPVQSQNAVIAAQVDASGNVLAVGFRIEIGNQPAETQSGWQKFTANFQNTLAAEGPDWNILIDPQSMVNLALGELQSGLSKLAGYTPSGPVTGAWVTPGAFNEGQIAFSNSGNFAVSECPNAIGVTISGTIDLQLAGSSLVEDLFIDWDLNDGDVFVCGLSYGGPIGALVGTLIAPGIGTIIGAVVGSIVGPIVIAIFATVLSNDKTLQGNFTAPGCAVTDKHHAVCTTSLALPPVDFGNGVRAALTVSNMVGQANGLLLGGTMAITPVGDPFFNISQPATSEAIGITGQCFEFQQGYSFSVALTGSDGPPSGPTTAVYGTPSQPQIQILGDAYNLYGYVADPDLTDWLPITLNFAFNVPQDSPYFASPYQPTLYVRTTSGAWSVALPKLEAYTAADVQTIDKGILSADISCNKEAAGWLGSPGVYNPHWTVDPGPEGDWNIWEIVAALPAGEQISAVSVQGVALATAPAEGVVANLSMAVNGVGARIGAAVPLSFTRSIVPVADVAATVLASRVSLKGGVVASRADVNGGVVTSTVDAPRPTAMATQRRLRRRATCSALGGELRNVTLCYYQNRISAIVAGSAGVEIFSLRNPARPTVVAIVPEALGAIPSGGGLVTWNRKGLSYGGQSLLDTPVISAVVCNGCVNALTSAGTIEIFGARLERVGSFVVEGATALAPAGRKLVVADPAGLVIYDVSQPKRPVETEKMALDQVLSLEPATAGLAGRILAQAGDAWTVIDAASARPYVAARYAQKPWFAGTANLGDVTVKPRAEGSFDVFTQGPNKTFRF
jgi:hypothetical protein